MSRLDYAPKLKEIRITNIKRGLAVFAPQPARAVSFAALRETLKKAGYALDSAEITVAGVVTRDGDGWWLVAEPTGQRFALAGADVEKTLAGSTDGARVELTGDWKTAGEGGAARETITPRLLKRADGATNTAGSPGATLDSRAAALASSPERPAASFAAASFQDTRQSWLAVPLADALPPENFAKRASAEKSAPASHALPSSDSPAESLKTPAPESPETFAPIRTTSPGLTVFRGWGISCKMIAPQPPQVNKLISPLAFKEEE